MRLLGRARGEGSEHCLRVRSQRTAGQQGRKVLEDRRTVGTARRSTVRHVVHSNGGWPLSGTVAHAATSCSRQVGGRCRAQDCGVQFCLNQRPCRVSRSCSWDLALWCHVAVSRHAVPSMWSGRCRAQDRRVQPSWNQIGSLFHDDKAQTELDDTHHVESNAAHNFAVLKQSLVEDLTQNNKLRRRLRRTRRNLPQFQKQRESILHRLRNWSFPGCHQRFLRSEKFVFCG